MAAKKADDKGTPVFPYTTEPKALRRLLAEIPKRPKPPKLDLAKLKSWDVSNNNNARTAINVLKKIGLVNDGGAPTENYVEFMKTGIRSWRSGKSFARSLQAVVRGHTYPAEQVGRTN